MSTLYARWMETWHLIYVFFFNVILLSQWALRESTICLFFNNEKLFTHVIYFIIVSNHLSLFLHPISSVLVLVGHTSSDECQIPESLQFWPRNFFLEWTIVPMTVIIKNSSTLTIEDFFTIPDKHLIFQNFKSPSNEEIDVEDQALDTNYAQKK